MDAIIRTENVSKIYGKGETAVRALQDVTISFEKEKMTAIIGASGSGKSTLLNIIGGLDQQADGKVCIEEQEILKLGDKELAKLRAEKIGFVFQFFKLVPELTALENILFPSMILHKKPEKSYVDALCQKLGIAERLKHYPSQLSGGQQQRTAIVRALINDPDILLCDEPTGNLDAKSGGEVMELLEDLCREMKKTIIIVTHDTNIANRCDRIVTISDGRIAGTEGSDQG